MSEWASVLAVFWVLWAWDGVRLLPRRRFSVTGGWRTTRARMRQGRLALTGVSPGNWGMTAAEVPLALSPEGLCNRSVGHAGRPAEMPESVQAWRWSEVAQVGVAAGWLFVNGRRFCPDTGHVTGPELLDLARLAPAAREPRIEGLMRRWLRPAHLRRRALVLVERTALPAMLNTFLLGLMAAVSIYVVGDASTLLPAGISTALARGLPALLVFMLLLHVAAVTTTRGALRRLASLRTGRDVSLLGALLFPPQALRLRAMVGEGFCPPQHPLALALAFGRKAEGARIAFHTLADLRWPMHGRADPALARTVTAWFGRTLEQRLDDFLRQPPLDLGTLLAAPKADAPESCSYCPRCRAQFVAGWKECPNGVTLLPLDRNGEDG